MLSQYFGYKFNDFLLLLGDDFPLLKMFSETKQDATWHGEIYLNIHIDMVLSEVYSIIKNNNFSLEDQDILIFSAIFHDYAKPISTKETLINNEKRLCSPRHEEMGASLLFFTDPPLGILKKTWNIILEIVAHHHIPKLLVIKNKEKKDYCELKRKVSRVDLLFYFEISDMRGRICPDKKEQIETMNLFRMFCEFYEIWDENPYAENRNKILKRMPNLDDNKIFQLSEQMSSRFENGQIWSPEVEIEKAFNYINEQGHLVILSGLPCSGKSTYIKENYSNYEVISLDEIRFQLTGDYENQKENGRVIRIAQEKLKDSLRSKVNIVWDATNVRKDFREKISQKGFDYGYFVQIVTLQTPLSLCLQRNLKRDRKVPIAIIKKMAENFEIPTLSEAHSLSFI